VGEFHRFLSPAKLNLVLAVHGRRDDLFHDITSLFLQMDFGDVIRVRFAEETAYEDFMECDVPDIPTDIRNTMLKALSTYRQIYNFPQRLIIRVEKNIPPGGGLGGGSSNAAYFLKNLNEMLGRPLPDSDLVAIAAEVGSDCAPFLSSSPCIVRGRGDEVERVDVGKLDGLRRTKFILFKPVIGISTAWAYGQLDQRGPAACVDRSVADSAVGNALEDLRTKTSSSAFSNCFQEIACDKYMELQLIFRDIDQYFRERATLTGSGSAGFIPLAADADEEKICNYLRDAYGETSFVTVARPLLIP
jgi:4-diphosphocytidyl-2-C-methyl-D-erythritol kinase